MGEAEFEAIFAPKIHVIRAPSLSPFHGATGGAETTETLEMRF